MHQHSASFDDPKLDLDDVPTSPVPAATFEVAEEQQSLFFSASWTLVARINGSVVGRSAVKGSTHSRAEVARWAREFIRGHAWALRSGGVKVEPEYVRWGGDASDLASSGD
jgi:hypothetical protein